MDNPVYKLLIVEDDLGIAQAIQTQASMWNFDVRIVENFRDVTGEVTSFSPHIILLDITLPFFNGYHWCSEIRKFSRVPIIFISSAADNMNIIMAMNLGADDFVAKPSITFAITFFFYNFPLEALTYPTLLCVCFGLFFFIWDFSKTKALHTRLMELSNLTELSVDMIRALPQSDSIENTDYQLLLSGLAEQILELKTAQSTRLTDMIDYYTVWVHQIKTPISSMRLTLQNEDSLLARKLSCDLSHIEQYVEMVLAFLRLDSDSSDYVFKMHELDPLLRQSIRRFSSEFINRKLSLSYTPPSDESGTLQMITDDKWFCFVIEQLLSNALKYTRTGTISIFFSQPKVLCIKGYEILRHHPFPCA